VGIFSLAAAAQANPPRDDFLNPQPPGRKLTVMPIVGPAFRAAYDDRMELEEQMSEARFQLIGTVAVPFAEISANLDVRLFLMTFGASAGYHDEWHVLQFEPDAETGRDRAGQPPAAEPPAALLAAGLDPLPPDKDPTTTFVDLDRSARALKDENGDIQSATWLFYEARWGFLWPGDGFMGVSTLAVRYEGRPNVSYDWENATVYSRGWHVRWEGYFLLRERNTGFAGPALRVLCVPRHRVIGNPTIGPYQVVVPEGSACQTNEGIGCQRKYEAELHYGVLAGLRPSWSTDDAFLVRVYAAWGLDERLFGLHTFRTPLEIQVAYMASVEL
jgi:hypothetical protein